MNRLLAGIYIVGTPVGHTLPVGPAVEFTVTYNQRAYPESGRMATSNLVVEVRGFEELTGRQRMPRDRCHLRRARACSKTTSEGTACTVPAFSS